MIQRYSLLLLSILCFASASFAQRDTTQHRKAMSRYNLELGLGLASYYGDLTQKATPFNQPHFATSAGISYQLSSRLQPSFAVSFLKVGADDKKNSRADLKLRNLNFKSLVWDFNLGLQFNILKEKDSRLSPYLYAGVGLFHFNPYTYDRNNVKRYLQPLGTEGQKLNNADNAYSLTQFQIPYGGGLKYKVSNRVQVKVDLLFRKIFTDYLDDVSTRYADPGLLAAQNSIIPQLAFRSDEVSPSLKYPKPSLPRGNPNSKDFYYTALLKVAYRL
jgi:opacity protein-like surface antigen